MRSTERCVNVVKVVESKYETRGKASDKVGKVVEPYDEIYDDVASEVNELSDIKDVSGTEAKQSKGESQK